MVKRIFLAINLPEELKSKLFALKGKWANLPARWVPKENIHLTLLFLGYLDEKQIEAVARVCQDLSSLFQPFYLRINRVIYGPDQRNPRMVWATLEKSSSLEKLQRYLREAIYKLEEFKYKKMEEREFLPHITLARIKSWSLKRMEDRPNINFEILLDFPVQSIEIMESKLKKTGAEYTILKSISLKENP